MFIPNNTCLYYQVQQATDNFGRHAFIGPTTARCTIISDKTIVAKSSVRADTSGSRGQVDQIQGDAIYLFLKTAVVNLGDAVNKDGAWLEVIASQIMYNALGKSDHVQVTFRASDPKTLGIS